LASPPAAILPFPLAILACSLYHLKLILLLCVIVILPVPLQYNDRSSFFVLVCPTPLSCPPCCYWPVLLPLVHNSTNRMQRESKLRNATEIRSETLLRGMQLFYCCVALLFKLGEERAAGGRNPRLHTGKGRPLNLILSCIWRNYLRTWKGWALELILSRYRGGRNPCLCPGKEGSS
jgi:hypothetical protein